jgi:hypothetical protein
MITENSYSGLTTKRLKKTAKAIEIDCLLQNELLGDSTEDLKGQCDEGRALFPLGRTSLFLYSLPNRSGNGFGSDTSLLASYSLSLVSAKNQNLLRTPRKATRKISPLPFKVLDAPKHQEDFCLSLVDWSTQNVLSMRIGSCGLPALVKSQGCVIYLEMATL